MIKQVQELTSFACFAALSCCLMGIGNLTYASAQTGSPVLSDAVNAQCEALSKTDFSNLPDGPAQILSAQVITSTDDATAHCEINGYSHRAIQFRIRMPLAGWNGKMLVGGTGGQAGKYLPDEVIPGGGFKGILKRGYAFVEHNGGHVSASADSKWGWNNEAAQIDYGFRSPHVAGAVGKAILSAFYGKKVVKSYYQGCSNGGREALMMAQRYPHDYDAIIAGAPSQAPSKLFIHMAWVDSVLKNAVRNGLDADRLALLHRAVMEQCDPLDGRKDGLIANPRKCKIDFSKVRCAAQATSNCLTPAQIADVRKVYSGPKAADGTQMAMSSVLPGSELDWLPTMDELARTPTLLAGEPATTAAKQRTGEELIEGYPREILRYLAFSPGPGPHFNPKMSDLEMYSTQMSYLEALHGAMDPDLRPFRDSGGKLLIYWGWNDVVGGTLQGIDYFEAVQRVMGGADQTADFAKMFMVPGMGHCQGGTGPWQINYLEALDNWVSSGKAPESLRGTHPASHDGPEFTREIRSYSATAE